MMLFWALLLILAVGGWAWYVRSSIQGLLKKAGEIRTAHNIATGDEKEKLGRLYNGIVHDMLAIEDSFPSTLVAKLLHVEKLTYLDVGVKNTI